LKTKQRDGERRERKEKEGRGERGEREKRRKQTAPLNGPSASRAYELAHLLSAARGLDRFTFFARFSYAGGALSMHSMLASEHKIHGNAILILRQEDG
jgi:hypothetical protein